MKNIFSTALLLLSILHGFSQDFTVENYKVVIEISEKGYFDVVENYDLNFEYPKHGIYRIIQTEYDLLNADGQNEKRKIKIDKIEVPNFKFEAPFDFEQKLQDNITIKIGDKDKTIVGSQHYEIKYRVFNAFLFEKDFIRFYWNLKPDGWNADFHQIDFTIRAPKNLELNEENSFAYSGIRGDSLRSKDIQMSFEGNQLIGKSISGFVSRPGESITVLMNLPVDSVKELKPLWPFWTDYGWVFLVGALVSGFYYVWRKFGKDDKVVTTTSYYAPENMDPAMAGFLIDDREDNADLIALIPYWGNKGLIRIEEIPKKGLFGKKADTKIIQIKELPNDVPTYEREIFIGLFGSDFDGLEKEVLVSSLKDSFYTTMNSAKTSLKENAQPYYEAKSKKVQTITLLVLIGLAIVFGAIGLFFWGIIALIVIVITCVILLVFNMLMIKKNAKGNQLLSELKGFKQFIKVAEENKLKMLLKDDPGYFENTMGYALAFGLFEKWAKKFEALHVPPPNWYTSSTGHYLGMRDFSKSFSGAMSSTQSTMVSSPKSSGSSGGGSSGGGFGGGGGGSW